MKKFTGIVATTVFISTLLASSFSSSAASDKLELKYEFESGTGAEKVWTDGGFKDTNEAGEDFDMTNPSGNGFVFIGQKGNTVTLEVEVPKDSLYELSICYCEPHDTNKKDQYLNVNGVSQGEVSFKYNLGWQEIKAGIIGLKEGKNTVSIEAYWGYTYFDYLVIRDADESIKNLTPTKQLSNKNASQSTKNLYSYLTDVYGKHIISGQQENCGSHSYNLQSNPNDYMTDNENEFEYLLDVTGKAPAIRGIDFLNYHTDANWNDYAAERTIQWVNEDKGIATVCWHWRVPTDNGGYEFYTSKTDPKGTNFSVTNAVTEGTWEHDLILSDIAEIAKQLQKLKDADVPIIWRPLHEAEGGWFWWGAEGAEPCVKLYRLLYDKLTNEYGLDNLIWEWTGYTFASSPDWYPGDDVVDMVGYDKYNSKDGYANQSAIPATFYSLVSSTDGEKMVAMSENDSIPSLENLVNDKAAWLYFCPWYGYYLEGETNNPKASLNEMYNSEYCITLDELPDYKNYTSSSVGDVEDKLFGDANEDGKIDTIDVLLVKNNILGKNESLDTENCDLNQDGSIGVEDIVIYNRFILGNISKF